MITIYTDGACSGNPGLGGWGAVIIKDNGQESYFSGSQEDTTNKTKDNNSLPPETIKESKIEISKLERILTANESAKKETLKEE